MDITRYDPWGVGQLQNEINRLFSNLGGENESSGATAGWVPNVDIHEYADRFQLFIDIPGVEPSAVEITLDNGMLSISGERTSPAPAEGEKATQRRVERGFGKFYRRFILPDTVDAEKVKATDRHGVLEIAIPKQAKAKPRRIEVAG